LLLSIENLNKLVFVFDGVDTEIKNDKKLDNGKLRLQRINKFVNSIYEKPEKRKCRSIVPSLFDIVTFIQFIRDISEKIQNIEVKFPLFEADRFISVLANEYNG